MTATRPAHPRSMVLRAAGVRRATGRQPADSCREESRDECAQVCLVVQECDQTWLLMQRTGRPQDRRAGCESRRHGSSAEVHGTWCTVRSVRLSCSAASASSWPAPRLKLVQAASVTMYTATASARPLS